MAGTTTKSKRTQRRESDVNDLLVQYNKLVGDVDELRRAVTYQMPGAVLTSPALKTGTTSAKTLRAEAFTFTFRGKITSASAQEKAFASDTSHDVAASKEAWFVLSTQTDGSTFTITKAADQTIGTVVLPTGPDNEIIVGYLGMVTGSTGFDATTDDLAVAGNIIASLSFVSAPAMGAAAFLGSKIGNLQGAVISA
jgi:hypothetical protein